MSEPNQKKLPSMIFKIVATLFVTAYGLACGGLIIYTDVITLAGGWWVGACLIGAGVLLLIYVWWPRKKKE